MTYFFISIIQTVLPFSVLSACVWQTYSKVNGKRLFWLVLFGFVLGVILMLQIPQVAATNLSLAICTSICILFFYFSQWFRSTKLVWIFQSVMTLLMGMMWAKDPNIATITGVDVINTDFILHSGAVILGLFLSIFIGSWLYFLFKQSQCTSSLKFLPYLISSIILLLILLPTIGDILLGLIKLQLIELTKERLSFVAKVTTSTQYLNYLITLVLFLSLSLFYIKLYRSRREDVLKTRDPIEKRKKQALCLYSRRVLLCGVVSVLVVVISQGYWDKVASLPPQLSAATPVNLDTQNQIHIPIEQVKDGKLHRFVWIADDGKAVRFFIINRLKDRLSLAVVFDACILCGDQGYVMEGGQVVCIGCGVRMFTPSIGKAGGCNPVPIENWQQTDNDIIISKKSLEDGLNYFSTILEIEVVDPVDYSKLKNTQTEYKYSYQGKTYFFATEKNLNLFYEKPENYLQ